MLGEKQMSSLACLYNHQVNSVVRIISSIVNTLLCRLFKRLWNYWSGVFFVVCLFVFVEDSF